MNIKSEAESMVTTLYDRLPQHIDGKKAVRGMKRIDDEWRQMEWIGFFFEALAVRICKGSRGPTIEGTTFDFQARTTWDFKAHTKRTASGNKRYDMYLNDAYSMERCIENGGLGFIVAEGDATYDHDGEFYEWHQELKGGPSEYTKKRRERGASSRTRKKAFDIEKISAYYIEDIGTLQEAQEDGWIRQQGQGRNADGSARNDKYVLKPHNVPAECTLAERKY